MILIKASSVSDGDCLVVVENLEYYFLHDIKLETQSEYPSVVFGKSSEENPNICRSYYRMGESHEYGGCCDVTFLTSGYEATSVTKN